MLRLAPLFLLLIFAIGCNSSENNSAELDEAEQVEDNVLIDYVKTPKDKASRARQAVENIDKERQKQIDLLD